jgi:hypothetical protein
MKTRETNEKKHNIEKSDFSLHSSCLVYQKLMNSQLRKSVDSI